MWIIPSTYCHYAVDTEDSNSALKECLEASESSLMWRSKPSLLRTWLIRWKRDRWLRHLCGRILRPSERDSFEVSLISSLGGTPVSHSVLLENATAVKIHDTFGPLFGKQFEHQNPDGFFSKMLKDISVKGSYKSSPIWKQWRTRLSREYSARKKSALHTRERGCLSWRTPATQDPGITIDRLDVKPGQRFYDKETGRNAQYGLTQQVQIKNWQTPEALNHTGYQNQKNGSKIERLGSQVLMNWPTPDTCPDAPNSGSNKKNVPKNFMEAINWPTVRAGEYKDCGPAGSKSQVHMSKRKYLCAAGHDGQPNRENPNMGGKSREQLWGTPRQTTNGGACSPKSTGNGSRIEDQAGVEGQKLNPDWVEQLQGLPVGWTALDYSVMELYRKQQN